MKEQIEKIIISLAKSADVKDSDLHANMALKYSQAALNLAHVIATLKGADELCKK